MEPYWGAEAKAGVERKQKFKGAIEKDNKVKKSLRNDKRNFVEKKAKEAELAANRDDTRTQYIKSAGG